MNVIAKHGEALYTEGGIKLVEKKIGEGYNYQKLSIFLNSSLRGCACVEASQVVTTLETSQNFS